MQCKVSVKYRLFPSRRINEILSRKIRFAGMDAGNFAATNKVK